MKKKRITLYLACIIAGLISCEKSNNKTLLQKEYKKIIKTSSSDSVPNRPDSTSISIYYETLDGWLKDSIDQKKIIEHLGQPEKKDSDQYIGAYGTYVQIWEYTTVGISLEMESVEENGHKIVAGITIKTPCQFKTNRNIGIGSDVNSIMRKYSELINKSESGDNQIVLGSIYGGTIFTLKRGKVSKIFIGAAAE